MAQPDEKRRSSRRLGKYHLVEKLGQGGMAEVWKAKMRGPAGFERTLVVKRILRHLLEEDPQMVEMFLSEARLSARLNHSNIVQVYELGEVEGEYFIAMEYVRGRDLVALLRELAPTGQVPPGVGAYIGREVCRALAYAHALSDDSGAPLRLIHRDVSPSNVMLGYDGSVKLLDFGIAKALGQAGEKTQTGLLKGKFSYMAPEQVEGHEIDHRSDLFAAGIVLYECLTASRLFKGASDLQTIALVREARVGPPSERNPEVPPELDRICLKALSKNPNERYQTCDQMARELDEVVHNLKWGPERLAEFMAMIFPEEQSSLGEMRPLTQATAPSSPASRKKTRNKRAIALLGLGAFGAAALTTVLLLPSKQPKPTTTATTAPPVPSPVQPAQVNVSVETTPIGAEVFVGEEPTARGKTPLQLKLDRSSDAVKVRVHLEGHRDETVEVVPNLDTRLKQNLQQQSTQPLATTAGDKGLAAKKPIARPPVAKAPTAKPPTVKPGPAPDKPKPEGPKATRLDPSETVDPFSK